MGMLFERSAEASSHQPCPDPGLCKVGSKRAVFHTAAFTKFNN